MALNEKYEEEEGNPKQGTRKRDRNQFSGSCHGSPSPPLFIWRGL